MIGLTLGLVALVIGWLIFLISQRAVPLVGVLISAATLATLGLSGVDLGAVAPAMILIVGIVAVTRLSKGAMWLKALASIPGAVWLAAASPLDGPLQRSLMVVGIPVLGMLLIDFERRNDGLGLGVIFFALATMGMFLAVPDTEWALSLMAVSVVLTFMSWPKVAGSLGPEGSFAAVATFILVTVEGGSARPPSILGSLACFGLLVLEPVVVAIKPKVVNLMALVSRNWRGAMAAAVPQLALVLVSSRIAARFHQFLPAVVVIAVTFVTAGIVAARFSDSVEDPERASG